MTSTDKPLSAACHSSRCHSIRRRLVLLWLTQQERGVRLTGRRGERDRQLLQVGSESVVMVVSETLPGIHMVPWSGKPPVGSGSHGLLTGHSPLPC